MTLCNMVVEAGGKNGVVPADSTTFKYLEVSDIDNQMHLVLVVPFACVCTFSHMYVLVMHVYANTRLINHGSMSENPSLSLWGWVVTW